MEVLEVTGTSYPTAIEIPVSRERPISKHQKSPGGNSGAGSHKTSYVPRLGGKLLSEQQKLDQQITADNRKVMLLHNGKKRFVRAADYERLREEMKVNATA